MKSLTFGEMVLSLPTVIAATNIFKNNDCERIMDLGCGTDS